MSDHWMKCPVPTIRRLVEIKTGRILLEFYVPAESEVTVTPWFLVRTLDRAGMIASDVEWQDEPL